MVRLTAMLCCVKFTNCAPFKVNCGVRQGGVLSPFPFAIYVDDLIFELRQSGVALYNGSSSLGHCYMPMIALLACSCLGLQKLINMYGMRIAVGYSI